MQISWSAYASMGSLGVVCVFAKCGLAFRLLGFWYGSSNIVEGSVAR